MKLLEKAKEISDLKRQVEYELIPRIGGLRPIIYRADFTYVQDGKVIVEDSKGFRDRVYKLKCRLMLFRHSIAIRET